MIIKKNDKASIETAVDFLRKGKVVVLPTDTVYGFSGVVDGTCYSYETNKKIFELKGRSEEKPLIQLLANPEDIKKYTNDVIPDCLFSKWPGALTIVVHNLSDKNKTTAFRCPDDAWLRKVIEGCNTPIYSTSVNHSGKPVLDNVQKIVKEFGNVDLIIDDGDKNNFVPSTIVKVNEDGSLKILRQGSVIIDIQS